MIHPTTLSNPSYFFSDTFINLLLRSSRQRTFANSYLQSAPYGPVGTYTTFGLPEKESHPRIDFIFVAAAALDGASGGKVDGDQVTKQAMANQDGVVKGGEKGVGGWVATKYAVIENHVEDGDETGWKGRWSDHRILRVEISRE